MPIYEFRCAGCGHVFEELCRFDEEGAGLQCPRCGHVGSRRLISVFAATGLENGHNSRAGARRDSGSAGKSESSAGGSTGGEAKGCGPGCGCHK